MTTRVSLRHIVSRHVEGRDFALGDVTSMSSNNIRSNDLLHYPDDHFNKGEIYVYAGTAIGQSRRVSDFATASGEVTPVSAFSPNAVAGDDFEIHPHFGWTVAQLNAAIDQAHYAAEDVYLLDKVALLTLGDEMYEYAIPSGWRYLSAVQEARNYLSTGYGSDNRDAEQGLFVTSATQRLAQGFQVSAAGWIGSLRLWLRKTESPTVNLTASIFSSSSGLPNASLRASSTVAASGVTTDGSFITFELTSPYYLAASTTYHVVLQSSQGALDATNYVAWAQDTSSPSYSNGDASNYNGSAWSAVSTTTRCFWLAYPERYANYETYLPGEWYIAPSSKLVLPRYDEGRPIRLIGQGQATLPTADSSTIELPEAYVIAKATARALGMQAGTEARNMEERRVFATYWEQQAEMEKVQMRVQPYADSVPIEAR